MLFFIYLIGDYMKIGIPRSFVYYYFKDTWKYLFEKLNVDVIISPKTNKEILDLGNKYSNDEMCLSLKNYIGHVAYLKDKCDYILIPRIDNYGISNQTCTNYLAIYDIINNLFDIKILNYNINMKNKETELKGLINIGKILGVSKKEIKSAYMYAKIKSNKDNKKRILQNLSKLNSNKTKVLLISHSYNTYDELIGKPIINFLNKLNIEIIYSDLFDLNITNKLSKNLSNGLYWKFSKDSIGAIEYCKNKINGVIFLSTFPCGLDSLVNELVMRKIDIPYLNLIIDDLDSSVGLETRIESFIDILEQKANL